jgi:lysyl-tRNA synthetase class 2
VDLELLQERARIMKGIRRFFDERNYLEAGTPALAPNLIPESRIEAFETTYTPPASPDKGFTQQRLCRKRGQDWQHAPER